MKLFVIDMDGTLCNAKHREHLAQAKCWDEFHAGLADDEPNQDVLYFLQMLMKQEHSFIFLTGRNEAYRNQTVQWLIKHDVYADDLLMRPDGNFQPDAEIKPYLLRQWLDYAGSDSTSVVAILEDRDKMVECWRNLGYACWQVRVSGY